MQDAAMYQKFIAWAPVKLRQAFFKQVIQANERVRDELIDVQILMKAHQYKLIATDTVAHVKNVIHTIATRTGIGKKLTHVVGAPVRVLKRGAQTGKAMLMRVFGKTPTEEEEEDEFDLEDEDVEASLATTRKEVEHDLQKSSKLKQGAIWLVRTAFEATAIMGLQTYVMGDTTTATILANMLGPALVRKAWRLGARGIAKLRGRESTSTIHYSRPKPPKRKNVNWWFVGGIGGVLATLLWLNSNDT